MNLTSTENQIEWIDGDKGVLIDLIFPIRWILITY